MKYFMIMTIVLFIFSGCSDDDTSSEQEETLAISEEDCQAKGANWQWDEATKTCKSKVSPAEGANTTSTTLSLKEKCENKGPIFVWDETVSTKSGPGDCFGIVRSRKCKDPAKPIFDYKIDRCVAPYITFFSRTHEFSSFSLFLDKSSPFDLDRKREPWIYKQNKYINDIVKEGRKCIAISDKEISLISMRIRDATHMFKRGDASVCSVAHPDVSRCPTEPGVYEILAGRTSFVITKVNKTIEELKALRCFHDEKRKSITDRNNSNPSSEWQ